MENLFTCTPPTNRGVQTYSKNAKSPYFIGIFDWFSVTLKNHTLKEVFSYFKVNKKSVTILDYAVNFYDKTYVVKEKIKILYSAKPNMGIHIMLSGRACRELEMYYDWSSFFQFITKYDKNVGNENGEFIEVIKGYNVTRIDIAYDYINYNLDVFKKIDKHLKSNCITSKFKKVDKINTINVGNYELLSNSYTFGSRSSNIQIQFYDKLKERNSADYEVDKNVINWLRMEVRFKNDNANLVFEKYLEDKNTFSDYCLSVIYNYIDFKEISKQSKKYVDSNNRHKLSTAKWYVKFINEQSKKKLQLGKIYTDITKKKTWIDNSVIKSLSMLYVTDFSKENFRYQFLGEMLRKGANKISDSDMSIINQHLSSNHLPTLTLEQVKEICNRFC